MSRLRPIVPGGETDRINKQGAQDLYEKLQLQCAGWPIEQVLVALTRSMSGLMLFTGKVSCAEAEALVDVVVEDIKNELRLNWGTPAHLEALAEMHRQSADPATRVVQ